MYLKLIIGFLLITVLGCPSNKINVNSIEQDVAFNLVKKNQIFKDLELRCDSISKSSKIPSEISISVIKTPLNQEDSINKWQTVFLECSDKMNETTQYTLKVDTINKKIVKIEQGMKF